MKHPDHVKVGTADVLLRQLRELGQRKAPKSAIAPDLRARLDTLLDGLPKLPAYANANPVIHGAVTRLRDAWRHDALRLLHHRDIETVRTFMDTVEVR